MEVKKEKERKKLEKRKRRERNGKQENWRKGIKGTEENGIKTKGKRKKEKVGK
jgi:hypothetical protein